MRGRYPCKAAGSQRGLEDPPQSQRPRRCGPTLSALVTDIQLPGRLNGWQVAEAGREAIDGLPIVYVTASDEADFRVRGVPRSVMVAKPFEWRQVVQAISSVLARSDQLPLNLVATR